MDIRLDAEWTDDCSGKKDYDGSIVSISTRYWPRGGSALVFDSSKPELGLHKFDDGSKPSASSSLYLERKDNMPITLTEKDFEGESFEEVAAQVEEWAQKQMNIVVDLLKMHFTLTETH